MPVRAATGSVEPGFWQQLKSGGYVLLVRHAGTDPAAVTRRASICKTASPSAAGREEARQLGGALKQLGIPIAAVRSSRWCWCRCLDTARLAFGNAQPWPALDNTFETPAR